MLCKRDGARNLSSTRRPAIGRVLALFLLVLLCLAYLPPTVVASPTQGAEQPQILYSLDTVVILAETTDTPGKGSLYRFQALAQAANWYYGLNSYGRVDFSFTFMDADGPAGTRDWYNVGSTLSAYTGNEGGFVLAALQQALAGADWPESVYLQRAIVVYAGAELLSDAAPFSSATFWQPDASYVDVARGEHHTRVFIGSLILVCEQDDLGTWVHELGHTLCTRQATRGTHGRISDRYNYYDQPNQRYGDVGRWDLMGSGSRWGNPIGTSPTHMSSYTKEAAGWLHYRPASLDQTYELTGLENQKMGDAVLALDDPLSDDPLSYYILEARDSGAFFGAPESGVMLYHVTYDHQADHAVVDVVSPQQGDPSANQSDLSYQRPTLHSAASADAAREYTNAVSGFRVVLLAESFSPYRATVRIERYSPLSGEALLPAD